MAYIFGDGFDCYATMADPLAGYWDSGLGVNANWTLVAGRFAGSQGCRVAIANAALLVKSSALNDTVHHVVCAIRDNSALTGASAMPFFQLSDGATAQCSIVFRQDGAILLTSSGPTGTTLATYTGAITAQSTWFAFEFEVVVNNTTGAFRVRKNGNTANDFDSGNVLNTRGGTANNYANKLTYGCQTAPAIDWYMDDLLWRSDAASVPFVGDIRCYTRMPASDASVQFARSPSPFVNSIATSSTGSTGTGTTRYSPLAPAFSGTFNAIAIAINTAYTGNLKCTIFADNAGNPGAVVGSATTISNPVVGNNTLNFGTPVTVTKGASYWVGVAGDVTVVFATAAGTTGKQSTAVTYAAFPTANPTSVTNVAAVGYSVSIAATVSADYVSEPLQDGTTSYVFSANVNDQDLYTIAAIAGTPVSVVAVTTRGFLQKSDAGTRGAAVQLKSGATTVSSTPTLLSSSFGWMWRTDTTDPNGGGAWTAATVNNVTIGPKVTS